MKVFVTILFLCSWLIFHAQINLVPNPSFEIIDSCPYSVEQGTFASPWFNPTPPPNDLYNSCSSQINCSVPLNWLGFQHARSGLGYSAIAAYNYTYNGIDNRREYLATVLLSQLELGKKYCVSFYVSLADSSYWSINRLGMYISQNMVSDNLNIDTLAVIPQVYHDTLEILSDTSGWVRIYGIYTAIGGERYITIGNFYADNQTDTIANKYNSWFGAYYYIDDLAVYELAACEAGVDRVICLEDSTPLGTVARPNVTYQWSPAAGLSDATSANPMAAPEYTTTYILTQTECDAVLRDTVTVVVDRTCHSANALFIPTLLYNTQPLFVSGLESGSKFELFDAQGKLVYRSFNYENNFYLHQLHAGVYIAVLSTPNGTVHAQKIVVLAAD